MDPTANRRETSAVTLRRVERNDPTLTKLEVSSIGFLRGRFTHEGTGYYWPNDASDLARLGEAIGDNTVLESLKIPTARNLADMAARNGAFFEGINRNASIRRLEMSYFDLSGGDELVVEWTSGDRRQFYRNLDLSAEMGRKVLNGFMAKNVSLTDIVLEKCPTLGNGGASVLTSAVSGCTSVTKIELASCNIDDDILVELISGIRTLQQLSTLDLSGNHFWRAGCEALATLLKDSDCNLQYLGLCNNRIDNECAKMIANSLRVNRKLERLVLSGDSDITASGWDAFSQALCNTSSVNDTFYSNHTLYSFGSVDLPTELLPLLEMNFVTGVKGAAMRKILTHHAQLDMTPFHVEWDLKVLPLVVSWFHGASEYAQNDESDVNARKLSAIYQFAKALPMLFVPPSKMAHKRKIRDAS